MPTALILGGSGKVARIVARQLAARGDTVYSVIRKPEQQASLQELGAKPILQSIEDSSVEDFTNTFKKYNPDVIIWSAGAAGQGGPERTRKVDYESAVKTFDAAAAAGIKRYIMVSGIDMRDRENKPIPEWYNDADKKTSDGFWNSIGVYCKAKFDADKDLVTRNGERGLKYTIVRPCLLTEDAGTGKILVGKVPGIISGKIAREDVASVVVASLDNDATIGKVFDLAGGEEDIKAAVSRVGTENIDNFEGFY